MKYTSEVAITIDEATYKRHTLGPSNKIALLFNNTPVGSTYFGTRDPFYYWSFSDIEWDEEMPLIKEVVGLMDTLDTDTHDHPPYAFLRIGEGFADDIHIRGDTEFYGLYLTKYISTGFHDEGEDYYD